MHEPASRGKAEIPAVVALVALPGVAGAALAEAAATTVSIVRSTTAVSDEILEACQSTRWAPPEYHPGWSEDAVVRELATRQVRHVEATTGALGSGGALWFDERHALLLELWQNAAPGLAGSVLVWGTPQQARDELRAEGIGPVHATALWELGAQRALRASAGRNVFISSVAALCDGTTGAAASLAAFLTAVDVEVSSAAALVDALTGMSRAEPGAERDDAEEHNAFFHLLSGLAGAHASLDVTLPNLSDTSTELLSAHRQAHRLGLEARTAWILAERRQRESLAVRADLSRTMAGADLMVSHLLNLL